ncbi:hypothetical protein L484_016344 [Morus notabilis]|uniref:Uncharacterized protein n=1 Tax=Morus notabilis TaxID=981085 RepID=W9QZJ7_9ROSA|nr:hypothetical protein L484_016344 [Morus notabilis]
MASGRWRGGGRGAPSGSEHYRFGSHCANGSRRRFLTTCSAAAAARTSGYRNDGWSASRLCTGIMLYGSDSGSPAAAAGPRRNGGDGRWRRLMRERERECVCVCEERNVSKDANGRRRKQKRKWRKRS